MTTRTAYRGLAVGQYNGTGFVRGATSKQAAYISRLLNERIHDLPYKSGNEVNIRHASRIIDHLLECPVKPTAAAPTGERLATEKQLAFIDKLLAERGYGNRTEVPTAKRASEIIDTLLAAPPVKKAPAAELEAAIYLMGDVVVKVQRAVHGSGNMYAKRLDPATGRFEYEAGLIRKITPAMRMTLEQAKEFGAIYGVCCNCGRTLTNEDSIEAGIGPVCAGKFI